MPTQYVQPFARSSGRYGSPSIWGSCNLDLVDNDVGAFITSGRSLWPYGSSANITAGGPNNVFTSATGVIGYGNSPSATQPLGLALAATVTNEVAIIRDLLGRFLLASGQKPFWYESGIAVLRTTSVGSAVFVGLLGANATLGATVPLNAGALADTSFVGFFVSEAGAVSAVHRRQGQALVTVASLETIGLMDVNVRKCGLRFIPSGDREGSNRCVFFYNGDRIGSVDVSATTFPNDVYLLSTVAYMARNGASSGSATLLWYNGVQLL